MGSACLESYPDYVILSGPGGQPAEKMSPIVTMDLNWKEMDGLTIARLNGRLDIAHSDEFESAVLARLDESPRDVLINLSGVTYMSSSGIRALLAIYRHTHAQERRMTICDPSPVVKKILDVVDIDQIFQIYDHEEKAIEALAAD